MAGQVWRKLAVVKLLKSHLVLLTKYPNVGDTFEPPILPPLNRSRPKFCERCRQRTLLPYVICMVGVVRWLLRFSSVWLLQAC